MKHGYYIDEHRKCRFSVDYVTPGEKGLAWAILLKAIEDGCSRDWLRDIVRYYGIDFDEALLDRQPANKIKLNNRTSEMLGIQYSHHKDRQKLVLSLQDGLHVRGLANVALE